MHCGTVVGGGGVSDEVGAGAGVRDDGRETGCLKCLCEICPRRPMETFERYGPLVRGWVSFFSLSLTFFPSFSSFSSSLSIGSIRGVLRDGGLQTFSW